MNKETTTARPLGEAPGYATELVAAAMAIAQKRVTQKAVDLMRENAGHFEVIEEVVARILAAEVERLSEKPLDAIRQCRTC